MVGCFFLKVSSSLPLSELRFSVTENITDTYKKNKNRITAYRHFDGDPLKVRGDVQKYGLVRETLFGTDHRISTFYALFPSNRSTAVLKRLCQYVNCPTSFKGWPHDVPRMELSNRTRISNELIASIEQSPNSPANHRVQSLNQQVHSP